MLIEKAKDPKFWQKAASDEKYEPFRHELEQMWENDCTQDILAIKYSEYKIFWDTGSRDEYEASYFKRRRAMNVSALLSMLYPERAEYMEKLCDVIWAILDEYTWVLPAHSGELERAPEQTIDLFCAETGFALSEIDYILADRLPPLIRRRISNELDKRIINEFINNSYSWETCNHNWGPVCVGSVCAAFLYHAPSSFPLIRARVEKTIECYLSGFRDDGVCLEGFGYWQYGFGFFVCLADLLRSFTSGELDFFKLPKVRYVASFPYNVQLGERLATSFSDAGPGGEMLIGLAHYLKHEYPELPVPFRRNTYTNDNCARWCLHLRSLLWYDSELKEQMPNDCDYWAENSQILVRRQGGFSFAAKGGSNNEPHNHNDIGSFITVFDGKQLLADPGPGVYSRSYFGAERYEDFCASSRGHSVPIINGKYQLAGPERFADAEYKAGKLTLDISRAYELPVGSVIREFCFGERTVTLRDSFKGVENICERFIAGSEPKTDGDKLSVGSLSLSWRGGGAATVSPAPKKGFWCIDIDIASPVSGDFELVIKY